MKEKEMELKDKIEALYKIRDKLKQGSKKHGLDYNFESMFGSFCICDIWNKLRIDDISSFPELRSALIDVGIKNYKDNNYSLYIRPAWKKMTIRPRLMFITKLIKKLEKERFEQ